MESPGPAPSKSHTPGWWTLGKLYVIFSYLYGLPIAGEGIRIIQVKLKKFMTEPQGKIWQLDKDARVTVKPTATMVLPGLHKIISFRYPT